jgi:hypothetical protein
MRVAAANSALQVPLGGTRTTLSPPSTRASRALNRTLAFALIALTAVACADAAGTEPPPSSRATSVDGGAPAASVDGDDLVLTGTDGTRTVVASIDRGELLHAEVRPGVADPLTVLALTRDEGRYELRYLTVVDGTPTDLYWFPARLQVAPDSSQVADVPTLPVWAPDGSGLAWLEWDADGTRLRTVGWFDHDHGANPSDEQVTYAVGDLPIGTQLERWEQDEDGSTVLITRTAGDERWRIRLGEDDVVVALEPAA